MEMTQYIFIGRILLFKFLGKYYTSFKNSEFLKKNLVTFKGR